MTTLLLTDVYTVVEEFKKICSNCFLSGSYRFGRATAESDIDIVFPIMFKRDVEIHIAKYGNVQPSYYNAGIKFTKMMGERAQTINAVFLHPLKGCFMKKLFGLEKRLINRDTSNGRYPKCYYHEWRLWRKYKTEKQRDEAFKALSSNRFMWEYRKINL